MRVLLGLQPLTTTAYLLRVLPAKHFDRGYEKLLMELLAIRLSEQKTLAKSLVMSNHPHGPRLAQQRSVGKLDSLFLGIVLER